MRNVKRLGLSMIALGTLVTVAPAAALSTASAAEARRLGSQKSLESMIEGYIREFGSAKKATKADPKAEAIDREIQQILQEQAGARQTTSLSERVAKLPGERAYSEQLLSRIRLLSRETGQKSAEKYTEVVSALVAEYYLRPERREAIHALLKGIHVAVAPQIRGRVMDPAQEYAVRGWGAVFTALLVWDSRAKLAELGVSTFRSVQEGAPALLKRLAKSKPAPQGGEQVQVSLRSQSDDVAMERVEEASKGRRTPDWNEILRALGERKAKFQSMFTNPRESLARFAGGSAKMLGQEIARTAKAVVLGGLPGYAWGVNETPKLLKMDPLEALFPFQALAVVDLEQQTLAARRALDREFSRVILEDSRGVEMDERELERNRARYSRILKQFVSGPRGFSALKKSYDHLSMAAPELMGNLDAPDLNRRIEEYRRTHWAIKRWPANSRDRATAFAANSKALSDLARDIEARIQKEAAKRGLRSQGELNLSLHLVEVHLAALDQKLRAIREALR